jgi:hypothetical protein
MIGIGHGGAGDLHTNFDELLFELMKHPISLRGDPW